MTYLQWELITPLILFIKYILSNSKSNDESNSNMKENLEDTPYISIDGTLRICTPQKERAIC